MYQIYAVIYIYIYIYQDGNSLLHLVCIKYIESKLQENNEIFHNILINELNLFLLQFNIDPWILNNKNETIFDIINPIHYSETNTKIYSLWGKHVLYTILWNDITSDPMNFNIFEKIKNNFDETTCDIYNNKINMYI